VIAIVIIGIAIIGVAAVNLRIHQNAREQAADRRLFYEREQPRFRSGERGESPKG
jgi:hypothetical protein